MQNQAPVRTPLVELHLHLEGIISHTTLRKQYELSGQHLPEEFREYPDHFPTFHQFVQTYYLICQGIHSEKSFSNYAKAMVDYIRANSIDYAEISWTPFYYLQKGMNFSRIMGVLNETLEKEGLRENIYFIIDTQRDHGPDIGHRIFREVFQSKDMNIVGIGLTGDEDFHSSTPFIPHFQKAKGDFGLGLTAHAGEYGSADHIRYCIENLLVDRIGHGIKAVDDPDLMHTAKEKNIHFEICPTSNVKLHRCPALSDHPIKRFFEQEMSVSINSDDPGIFKTSLKAEFQKVQNTFNWTDLQMDSFRKNAVHAVFHEPQRRKLLARFS